MAINVLASCLSMGTQLANLASVFIHIRVIRMETDDEFVQFIRFCSVCLLGLLFQKCVVECAMLVRKKRQKNRVRNDKLHTFPVIIFTSDEVTSVLVLV